MDDWEEWDAPKSNANGNNGFNGGGNVEVKEEKTTPQGKIFGSRGRGFSPVPSNSSSGRVGTGWAQRNGNGRKNDNWSQQNSSRRSNDDWSENQVIEGSNEDWDQPGCSGRSNDEWSPPNRTGRSNDGWSSDWDRDQKGSPNDQSERKGRGKSGKWTESAKDKGDENEKPKPKSTYVPAAPTEDEREIFGSGISSGINFSKYDDIEVRVSGRDPPQPISSFAAVKLQRDLMDLIQKCNYTRPTPIQKYAMPIILSGRDLMACAQTGSGKTAAYLIPIVSKLLEAHNIMDNSRVVKPKAVVVAPTRELAIQIFEEARKFAFGTFIKVAISYGGTAMHHQIACVKKGCDILVATPGRLLDFIRRGTVQLTEVKFFVLDEADRMLDMGFLPDMETLLNNSDMVYRTDKQTLMFSATFPDDIQRLAGKFLNDYLFVAVGIVGGACADVEQRFFSVARFDKRNKLIELLTEKGSVKTLVFVEQKRTTDFIATFLCEKDFPATSIHGDREQREREEALNDFKRGKMDILVATSVAARGLDIKDVAHVVNFDLPSSVDEYVHRIGRTGRVGNRGVATSFYDPEKDRPLASDLVKILSQAEQAVPDFLLRDCASGSSGGPTRFGGRDLRGPSRGSNDIGKAQDQVFEEETW